LKVEGFESENGRGRVVAVRAARLGRKLRDDDVRPKRSHHAHDVAQHLPMVPDSQRLLVAFGEPEIDRPGEKLLATVQSPSGQQLLRADHSELLVELGAEQVLPAVAPRDRQVGRAKAAAAGEVRDQLRILIIWVGRHVQ
jgi:hypothetical protein